MTEKIFLVCGFCRVKHANYLLPKTKKQKEKKLILKKYCKFCRKTQIHKETPLK